MCDVLTLLCSYVDESEAFDKEWRHKSGAGTHSKLPQAGGGVHKAFPPTPMDQPRPRHDPSHSHPMVSPYKRRQRPLSLSAEENAANRRQEPGQGEKHLYFNVRPKYNGPSSERMGKGWREHHRH